MKDMIGTIARAIVDAPEQVTVSEVEGGHTLVLELKVEKQDKGNYRQAG